ncbi:MAG: response regulator [bacterium]
MSTILIIDDVAAVRKTVRRMLERAGHEVLEAENGKEGLKAIAQREPDVVILDILMPEMEGIETIRNLSKSNPHLPIVAITASLNTPYLSLALKLGAVYGLYKPFSREELLDALNVALEKVATQ